MDLFNIFRAQDPAVTPMAWLAEIQNLLRCRVTPLRLESKAFRGEVLKVISHLQDWGRWLLLAAVYNWYIYCTYIYIYQWLNIYIYIYIYHIIVYCTLLFICSQWPTMLYVFVIASFNPDIQKIFVTPSMFSSFTVSLCIPLLKNGETGCCRYQFMRPETKNSPMQDIPSKRRWVFTSVGYVKILSYICLIYGVNRTPCIFCWVS